jgi:Fic family protein
MPIAFQNIILADQSNLIGFSWLVNHFNLNVPLREISAVSEKRLSSQRSKKGILTLFDTQFKVESRPFRHLEFALKHEEMDILVLKYILKSLSQEELIEGIKENPKRILSKKIWFYYEFLLDKRLDLEDLPIGKYDNLLDDKKYITNQNFIKSQRHKINNNLLGTSKFCPIILRTSKLEAYLNMGLQSDLLSIVGSVSTSLIRRASNFLLLSDSQASFEIEGDRVTKNRIENWAKVIHEAGKVSLSVQEIERLHSILLNDSRFIKIGLRDDEVFLGDRDRENFPIPEFIGARSEDLDILIEDWIELDKMLNLSNIDPILHAVIIAFSFVYIHPLEDGNGRIHRYLIHHVLAQRGYYPKGMIFPISNVILDEIEKYRDILVSHTSPLMAMIIWEATVSGNVKVLNDTSDIYRYFNCTKSCEFIYSAVEKTIKKTLPNELKYLNAFDKTYIAINEMIEMPNNKIKSLITFVLQNSGKLSKRKKEKYFEKLTLDEVEEIEDIVEEYFVGGS